jgi:hypothetical protein
MNLYAIDYLSTKKVIVKIYIFSEQFMKYLKTLKRNETKAVVPKRKSFPELH